MFTRELHLPKPGVETFFLWGPQQTGKSTLLKAAYPERTEWIEFAGSSSFFAPGATDPSGTGVRRGRWR
jgi:uncharacterized protein